MTVSIAMSPRGTDALPSEIKSTAMQKSPAAANSSQRYSLSVAVPDVAAGQYTPLVEAVVRLANTVFLEAEVGIWNEGFYRTTVDEVARMLLAGELALGFLRAEGGTAPLAPSADVYVDAEGQQLVGCVGIKRQSPTVGFINMLTLDKRYQGLGLARDLMAFAEKRCLELDFSVVGLDLLFPTAYVHPLKARMQAWYLRRGYRIVRLANFEDVYPDHARLLAGPVEFRVFEKRLD